jgi:RNA polymerase sigma-70 factor, ECF subfamily
MPAIQGLLVAQEARECSATESVLVEAGRAGDRAALERLLAPHKLPLLAFCAGMLAQADDAEDAAQETFLRALRALSSFRGDAAFRTWLFRIAINVCLNWKRDRHPTEPLDEARLASPRATDSPETLALRHLYLLEALGTLRPHQRAALLLKERERWSLAEIGAALGWNRKRVENELYRARRALLDWQIDQDKGEERWSAGG